tara:strand:+ start:2509 stop:2973 length:465 start_codon:yes stop_codon:yes gene_type:complete
MAAAKIKEKTVGPKKLSPFDFINNINEGSRGTNLMENSRADYSDTSADIDAVDKQYVPFMINRGLSYFQDTVLFANEMNIRSACAPKMQYDFFRNLIRPRKRFSKWYKKPDDEGDVAMLMAHYDYSSEKARMVLRLFTAEALDRIRKSRDVGGK